MNLYPCPKCGSASVSLQNVSNVSSGTFTDKVCCHSCKFEGPVIRASEEFVSRAKDPRANITSKEFDVDFFHEIVEDSMARSLAAKEAWNKLSASLRYY